MPVQHSPPANKKLGNTNKPIDTNSGENREQAQELNPIPKSSTQTQESNPIAGSSFQNPQPKSSTSSEIHSDSSFYRELRSERRTKEKKLKLKSQLKQSPKSPLDKIRQEKSSEFDEPGTNVLTKYVLDSFFYSESIKTQQDLQNLIRIGNAPLIKKSNSESSLAKPRDIKKRFKAHQDIFSSTETLIDDNINKTDNINKNKKMAQEGLTLREVINFKIPFYDGNPQDLDGFVNTCEMYNTVTPADLKHILLDLIKGRLTGEALAKIQPLANHESFEALKKILIDTIRKPVSYEFANEQLSNIFQRSNESVETFAKRVRRSLQRLNESTNKVSENVQEQSAIRKAHERLAASKFTQNLRSQELRVAVSAAGKTSLEECITYAMERELIDRSSNVGSQNCSICKSSMHKDFNCPHRRSPPRNDSPFLFFRQNNYPMGNNNSSFRNINPSNFQFRRPPPGNNQFNSFNSFSRNFPTPNRFNANNQFMNNRNQYQTNRPSNFQRYNYPGNNNYSNNYNQNSNYNRPSGIQYPNRNFSNNGNRNDYTRFGNNGNSNGNNNGNNNNNNNNGANRPPNVNRNARSVHFYENEDPSVESLCKLIENQSINENDRKNF